MPRQHRYELIAVPQHVIQRGNNRQPAFFAEEHLSPLPRLPARGDSVARLRETRLRADDQPCPSAGDTAQAPGDCQAHRRAGGGSDGVSSGARGVGSTWDSWFAERRGSELNTQREESEVECSNF